MGPLATLLSLPVSGPLGAVGWIARQVAQAALQDMLDPARIEAALLALGRRLESGEIDEATFEAEEARLLEELAEMRALRAGQDDAQSATTPASPAEPESEPESESESEPESEPQAQPEAEPWTAA